LHFGEQHLNSASMVLEGSPTPKQFGQALAQLRSERGVTLEEIIQRTKISRRVLEALEAGKFAALPDRVFARMFLRQILATMKEPAEAWLQAFDAAFTRFEDSSQSFPVVPAPPPRRQRVWPWLVAVSLLAGGLALLFLLGRPLAREGSRAVPPTPEVLLREPAATPSLLVAATPASTPSPSPPSTVLVVRTAGTACWVEVRVAGGERQQRLLPPNSSWEIEAGGRAVDLLLGDAGGVEVAYLGEVRSALGRAGEVVRVHLDGQAEPE